MTKVKQASLVACLFLFLFVVIGGGLHLSPGGAFVAAATGTPLVIHLLHRSRVVKADEHNQPPPPGCPGLRHRSAEKDADRLDASEREVVVRE